MKTDKLKTKCLLLAMLTLNSLSTLADHVTPTASEEIYTFQSTPMPTLSLPPAASNVGVGWTIPSASFRLQQNTNLNRTNWTDVMNPSPLLNLTNLQNHVALPRTNGSHYFRLVH